jgi:predicted transcriptional regulator
MAQTIATSQQQNEPLPHHNEMPVQIRGKVYKSHKEAAAELGVCDSAISQALIRTGSAEKVGLGIRGGAPGNQNGAKKLVLLGYTFNSRTEAANALGITRSQISKWISKRASTAQRQMLISALMQYAKRCDKKR